MLNPSDWLNIRTAKDLEGAYYAGSPFQSGPNSLWGTPVAVTTKQPAGTALVLNAKEAARIYVRQAPTIEVHPGGGGTTEWIETKCS